MQKRNRSPIDTRRRQKRKVGDIGVPKDWWDIARDLFFCRILSEDPYPVDVDKLSEESYKEAHEILSTAIKEFDVSKAAIHTVSIRMFQALFSSTDNQARGSPISCPSALRRTGS
jgi:hypothetical protein